MRSASTPSILRVTSLNSDGPCSLREALSTHGARIVVFEVAGVIDVNRKPLEITEPFVTIAGQTAPSPGITIIRGGITIKTHDILLQHLRVRPGDAEQPRRSGWEPEVTTSGPECYNIVVDHCSISWAVDENLSASGPRYNGAKGTTHKTTFSHNILAEGLYDSSHSKGIHSMGSLVHDNCTDIAVIGNLYGHNNQRNPYFKAFTTGVIVNNLIYNPGKYAIQLNWLPAEWEGKNVKPENARVSVVGNVMYHGADTLDGLALVSPKGDAFMEDNLAFDRSGKPVPLTAGDIRILGEKPSWPEGLKALPASEVVGDVIHHAGHVPKIGMKPISASSASSSIARVISSTARNRWAVIRKCSRSPGSWTSRRVMCRPGWTNLLAISNRNETTDLVAGARVVSRADTGRCSAGTRVSARHS